MSADAASFGLSSETQKLLSSSKTVRGSSLLQRGSQRKIFASHLFKLISCWCNHLGATSSTRVLRW